MDSRTEKVIKLTLNSTLVILLQKDEVVEIFRISALNSTLVILLPFDLSSK